MRSIAMFLLGGVAVLAAAACSAAKEKEAPPQAEAQAQAPDSQADPLQSAPDWRARMQMNHNADSSIERQVRRLTRDLDLTPAQQVRVRQLSRGGHNDRIQAILDSAPPTLTRDSFTVQVHAISRDFHDSVNAILTPRQLALMKAMVSRLDSGQENRRAP